MKKILLLLIALIRFTITQAQIVDIPDVNFKNALLSANTCSDIAKDFTTNYWAAVDSNNDGEIQESEAENISYLDVSFKNITDLTGIQYFINLTQLYVTHNQLQTLDVSTNIDLTHLNCYENQLSALDVSTNTNLTHLGCSFNELSNLDVSTNTNLTDLSCSYNELSNLDVSTNTNLTSLYCSENNLSTLDVSVNTDLSWLYCHSNQLSNLDVNTNINLTRLHCYSNQLSTLNVNTNTNLIKLYCGYNQLSSLDISTNINLTDLVCLGNQLSTLDLSSNTNLTKLYCGSNYNLTYLNLKNGNNTNLNTEFSSLLYLPNLETVCVDELNTDLTTFILDEINHDVTFSTDCVLTVNRNTRLDFSIYPIPTSNLLTINSKTAITKIEIYTKLGQLVLSNTNQKNIDISNLSDDIYFCKVINVNGNFGIQKVVKR